jgi:hypothetical protein
MFIILVMDHEVNVNRNNGILSVKLNRFLFFKNMVLLLDLF